MSADAPTAAQPPVEPGATAIQPPAGPGAAAAEPPVISVAAHPRARASIRRTRARTAIGAFVLVLLLSLNANVPGQEAVLRALAAGLAGNLIGWGCALAVWRQVVLGELRMAEQAHRERRRARAGAAPR